MDGGPKGKSVSCLRIDDDLLDHHPRVPVRIRERVAARRVDVQDRFVHHAVSQDALVPYLGVYSVWDEVGVAMAPPSIWILYLVSVFVFSGSLKSRSA